MGPYFKTIKSFETDLVCSNKIPLNFVGIATVYATMT